MDMLDECATLLLPFARLSQCSDSSRIHCFLVYLPILPKRSNMAIKGPQRKQQAQREIFFGKPKGRLSFEININLYQWLRWWNIEELRSGGTVLVFLNLENSGWWWFKFIPREYFPVTYWIWVWGRHRNLSGRLGEKKVILTPVRNRNLFPWSSNI